MTSHTRFPSLPAGVAEFEETRPALYFAANRWSHLPDERRRDRRAANDAARPSPDTPADRRIGWAAQGTIC